MSFGPSPRGGECSPSSVLGPKRFFEPPLPLDQLPPIDAVVPTFTSFGISADIAGLYRGMYEGIISGKVAFEGGKAEAHRGATPAEETLRPLAN